MGKDTEKLREKACSQNCKVKKYDAKDLPNTYT